MSDVEDKWFLVTKLHEIHKIAHDYQHNFLTRNRDIRKILNDPKIQQLFKEYENFIHQKP